MLFLLIRDLFSSFFSVISSYTGRFFFDVIFSSYSILERRKVKILESMHILSYVQIQQNWNGHFAKIVNIDLGAIGAINPLVHHL